MRGRHVHTTTISGGCSDDVVGVVAVAHVSHHSGDSVLCPVLAVVCRGRHYFLMRRVVEPDSVIAVMASTASTASKSTAAPQQQDSKQNERIDLASIEQTLFLARECFIYSIPP